MVQPIDANSEEATEKNELVDISAKDAQSQAPITKTEDSPCSSKEVNNAQTSNEEPAKNENALKGRTKPPKRKQVSDSKTPHKRPRGILKLRSKTIRIMK